MIGIEKLIALLLVKKGIIYGFLVGFMKVLKDIRDGKFNLVSSLTDLFGATIVGYIAYEIVALTELSTVMKLIWTLFLASNSFVVIALLSDKKMLGFFIDKYLKK